MRYTTNKKRRAGLTSFFLEDIMKVRNFSKKNIYNKKKEQRKICYLQQTIRGALE